jgi:hypothetical protein
MTSALLLATSMLVGTVTTAVIDDGYVLSHLKGNPQVTPLRQVVRYTNRGLLLKQRALKSVHQLSVLFCLQLRYAEIELFSLFLR